MSELLPKAVGGAAPTRGLEGVSPVRPLAVGRPHQGDFAELVAARLQAQGGVKLSAHAKSRIEARGLQLSADDSRSLQAAVDLAAAKGARQSLVMLNQCALIVNIPSRTVITAMESDGARGTVFTNIDSAVIAQGGDTGTSLQQTTELDLPGGSSRR